MAEVVKAGRADRGGKVTLNQHHEGSLGFQLSLAGFPGCRLLVMDSSGATNEPRP